MSNHPLAPSLARCLSGRLLRLTVTGADNVPLTGGVLLTMNHLGGADAVLVLGFAPRHLVTTGKVELSPVRSSVCSSAPTV